MTDRWERFYVTELVREQIFKRFQQEVPHACAVIIEDFIEKKGRKDVIKASIVVETEGQKKIVIGEQGRSIRDLGQAARKEIEEQIGRPVFLELVVKVKKNWRKDPEFLKLALGLSA
jgi:GTP-binding protein Era